MPTDQDLPRWVQFIICADNAEERTSLLQDIGVQGVEVLSPSRLRVFFLGGLSTLKSQLEQLGFAVEGAEEVQQQNWTKQCAELWEPIQLEGLTVYPVESAAAAANIADSHNIIKIIPGLGFGTGHHQATQHIIRLLQQIDCGRPEEVLDLGTGSGILAIVAAKLFDCHVTAIDTDPLAIENAKENVSINQLTSRVTFITGEIQAAHKEFDLILANLYGEILIELESEIFRRLRAGSVALLSGIADPIEEEVRHRYTASRWTTIKHLNVAEWHGLALRKV